MFLLEILNFRRHRTTKHMVEPVATSEVSEFCVTWTRSVICRLRVVLTSPLITLRYLKAIF